MPDLTLTPEETITAERALRVALDHGMDLSQDRIQQILRGETHDITLQRAQELRNRLRLASRQRVVIGRRAFNLLYEQPWNDNEVRETLDNAALTSTRVTVVVPEGVANLFHRVLSDAAEETGDKHDAERFRTAARAFVAS